MIDVKNLISDYKSQFVDLLKDYNDRVSEKDYVELHTKPLVPTNIKIDCDLFLKEIEQYQMYFEQWGKHHSHLPRYGLSLVNHDGLLRKNDPINGPLYEFNILNPDNTIIELDCLKPTEVMNISSLKPLSIFDGHWCRSNILKWGKGAEFYPHIDNGTPAPWIRLWATINEGIEVNFYDENTNQPMKIDKLEPGRVYLIDTSLVHDANSIVDDYVYQLFLCVLPSALKIVRSVVNE